MGMFVLGGAGVAKLYIMYNLILSFNYRKPTAVSNILYTHVQNFPYLVGIMPPPTSPLYL